MLWPIPPHIAAISSKTRNPNKVIIEILNEFKRNFDGNDNSDQNIVHFSFYLKYIFGAIFAKNSNFKLLT